MKIIDQKNFSPSRKKKIEEEIRLLRKLCHPNIVRCVLDFLFAVSLFCVGFIDTRLPRLTQSQSLAMKCRVFVLILVVISCDRYRDSFSYKDGRYACVVMALCSYGDLSSLIKGQTFSRFEFSPVGAVVFSCWHRTLYARK